MGSSCVQILPSHQILSVYVSLLTLSRQTSAVTLSTLMDCKLDQSPFRCAQLLDIEALGRLPPIFRQSSRLEEDVPFIRGKLALGSGRRFGEALVSNRREVWRVRGIVNVNLPVRANSISGGVRPTPFYTPPHQVGRHMVHNQTSSHSRCFQRQERRRYRSPLSNMSSACSKL